MGRAVDGEDDEVIRLRERGQLAVADASSLDDADAPIELPSLVDTSP